MGSPEARDTQRAVVQSIIDKCSQDKASLTTSREYIEAVAKLFSKDFLVGCCETMPGHVTGTGIKSEIVERLLKLKWVVPANDDLVREQRLKALEGRREEYSSMHDEVLRNMEADQRSETGSERAGSSRGLPDASTTGMSDFLIQSINRGPIHQGGPGQRDQTARNLPLNGPVSSLEVFFSSLAETTTLSSQLQREMLAQQQDKRHDIEHSGAVPRSFSQAIADGKFACLTQAWDRDIACARPGASERKTKPALASDMAWDDWILAMLNLSRLYHNSQWYNIGNQVLNLLEGALTMSAVMARISVMAACEDIRRNSTKHDCLWGLSSFQVGKAPIILRPYNPVPRFTNNRSNGYNGKRKFPSPATNYQSESSAPRGRYRPSSPRQPSDDMKLPPMSGGPKPCFTWLSGKYCQFSPCKFAHSCTLCGPAKHHNTSKCPLQQAQQARRHR